MILTGGRLAAIAVGIPLALGSAGWGAFTMVGLFAHTSERHVVSYPWQGGDITVNTSSGSVRVEVGTASTVDVTYTEHYELKRPVVSATTLKSGIQLTARCPGGIFGNNCDINYVITVPAAARLVLHSGNGGLQVSGSTGAESLDTGDGGITIENVSGDIVARTGNGGIHGAQLGSASVNATTGDGGIALEWAIRPTAVIATTGNGGIDLTVPKGGGPYRVSTHTGNGGVDVTVPTDVGASASITAQTGDGGIDIGLAGR